MGRVRGWGMGLPESGVGQEGADCCGTTNSVHGITAHAAVSSGVHLAFENGVASASVVGGGNALPFAGAVVTAHGIVGAGTETAQLGGVGAAVEPRGALGDETAAGSADCGIRGAGGQ